MEGLAMSLNELLPILQALSRTDKLLLLQFLAFELAKEEGVTTLETNGSYPIWTPYDAFEAADILLKALENEDTTDDA
jgi:hypothetical protein